MLFELGIINCKLLLPFIFPFLFQLRKYIHEDDERAFYEIFTNYIGYLLHGIVYLIILRRTKKRQKSFSEVNETDKSRYYVDLKNVTKNKDSIREKKAIKYNQSPPFYNLIKIKKAEINSRQTKIKYLYLFALACVYLIPMFLDSYCSSNSSINYKTSSSISLFFCIIAYVSLSRILLGDKIYKHQFFSLIIILVCNIISIILILIWAKDNSRLHINIAIMFIIYTIYALYNVVEKRYFNKFLDSPYHYMFVVGFISIIIILLYETITVLAASKNEIYNGIFRQIEINFESSNLYPLVLLGDIVSAFFWVMGIHLTVYFFTPCHFIISEATSQILSTIIKRESLAGCPVYIQIIIYILFFIIFFASLIYNEVIIINAFDLNLNTKKFIEERSENESFLDLKDDERFDSETFLNYENDE